MFYRIDYLKIFHGYINLIHLKKKNNKNDKKWNKFYDLLEIFLNVSTSFFNYSISNIMLKAHDYEYLVSKTFIYNSV